jgi:glycosyltransferase involved in cell wall biosynthesis
MSSAAADRHPTAIGGDRRTEAKHVVVPYGRTNSTVRTRAIHWVERLIAGGRLSAHEVVMHGPEEERRPLPAGEPVLLLRNARRITRGRTEARLLGRAVPGVYDLDDGLPWDDGTLAGLGRWWKRPFPRSLLAERAASAADRVVAGNEVLAEWASQHCSEVRIVPTCVEPSEYRPRVAWDLDRPPLIGWIGSPATEHYLVSIAPALATIAARTDARVEMISGPGDVPEPLAAFTTRTLWEPSSVERIGAWDVGLMPLADGVYERAKCGYKLLQYAASGVPAVASPVGVNRSLLAGMDGLAATTVDEWVDALDALLSEPPARREQRARRGFVVAHDHSYDTWEAAWVDAVGW